MTTTAQGANAMTLEETQLLGLCILLATVGIIIGRYLVRKYMA